LAVVTQRGTPLPLLTAGDRDVSLRLFIHFLALGNTRPETPLSRTEGVACYSNFKMKQYAIPSRAGHFDGDR
jgi:hypothetical protein